MGSNLPPPASRTAGVERSTLIRSGMKIAAAALDCLIVGLQVGHQVDQPGQLGRLRVLAEHGRVVLGAGAVVAILVFDRDQGLAEQGIALPSDLSPTDALVFLLRVARN